MKDTRGKENEHDKEQPPDVRAKLRLSDEIDTAKYRQDGEDFYSKVVRIADALKDSDEHFEEFKDILRDMRFACRQGSERHGCSSADNSF